MRIKVARRFVARIKTEISNKALKAEWYGKKFKKTKRRNSN
jgi:hypothetical protein